MADLESKLLDGEACGYCSDSDSENNEGLVGYKDDNDADGISESMKVMKHTRNTGPKGVLDDWKLFQRRQLLEEKIRHKKILIDAKRGMLSGLIQHNDYNCTDNEDSDDDDDDDDGNDDEDSDDNNKNSNNNDEGDDDDDDDDELKRIRQQRMQQIKNVISSRQKVIEIETKNEFLDRIDGCHNKLLLIHIYEDHIEGCITLNSVFAAIAVKYSSHLKLARVKSSLLNTSASFSANALPTLQIYYNGSLVGNFVRITDQLGEDFSAKQLITFLYQRDIDLDMNFDAIPSDDDDDGDGEFD